MRGPNSSSGFAYAPQSCIPLGGRSTAGELFGSAAAAALTSAASFGAFPDGGALFDAESLLEPLRWQLEACDRLQGVVALADVGSGWGGLARAYITAARDELLGRAPSAVLFGLLDEDDDGGGEHDDHGDGSGSHDEGADDGRSMGRSGYGGAGAGAGAGAGSSYGSSYGSRRSGGAEAVSSSDSSGATDFGAAARERRTMRSLNAALALQAFAGGSVGGDESADAGCTFIPLGASLGAALSASMGSAAAGGAGGASSSSSSTHGAAGSACGCGWAGMPHADAYACAISMLLDAGRSPTSSSASSSSASSHAAAASSSSGLVETWTASEDVPPPAWATAWDAPLETSGAPPLAGIPHGSSLGDALRLLRDGSGGGLGMATLRLAALPGMPQPLSQSYSGGGGGSTGGRGSSSSGNVPTSMTASALAKWLPSPVVDPRARSSVAEAAAVAAGIEARLYPLSWSRLRGRMPSSFGPGAAVAACPAHVQAHFAVLRCAVTSAAPASGRPAGGGGEVGYGSSAGAGTAGGGSLSLSLALGASAGVVARPAVSTAAALGRSLDGWLEGWRCRAAAHRVVGRPLPAATPLCMPASSAAASSSSSSPSSAATATRAALLHASVGRDAAVLLARAAGALARVDRSRLHRFAEEGSTGSGAGLDVAGLTDALLTMAEAAAGGIPGADE